MNWTIFHQEVFPIRHKLFRFALRITGSAQDAEDVVQEVLEKVWKTPAGQSEAVRNWEAWCMTMTRNRSLDKSRDQTRRRAESLDGVHAKAGNGIGPAEALEQGDMAARIRRMMHDLPEKQRLVMHLRDIEELSYDEIAETLGQSLEQVKTNLHRARKTIREGLLRLELH
jgi:RNA polymerase sigma factor (sigma-70 family)